MTAALLQEPKIGMSKNCKRKHDCNKNYTKKYAKNRL